MLKDMSSSQKNIKETLYEVYRRFLKKYGRQNWWPLVNNGKVVYSGKKPIGREFEVAVGAILAQNTNWKNVEIALVNLYKNKCLSLDSIVSIDVKKLQKLIYSTGYYKQKSEKLKAFAKVVRNFGGMKKFLNINNLRDKLLSIYGIGPETADTIILYCGVANEFIADCYTVRILSRMFGIKLKSYNNAKAYFFRYMQSFDQKEFHALFVRHAKEYCRKKPICNLCFLNDICKQHI